MFLSSSVVLCGESLTDSGCDPDALRQKSPGGQTVPGLWVERGLDRVLRGVAWFGRGHTRDGRIERFDSVTVVVDT